MIALLVYQFLRGKILSMRYKISVFSFCAALWFASCSAVNQDPYIHVRYSQVFDQTALYRKYYVLITQLGCAENVQLDKAATQEELEVIDPAQFEQFQEDCLSQLRMAQRFALAQPSIESLSDVATTGMVTAIIMACLKDSVAGGFAGTNAIYTAFYGAMSSLKSLYNVAVLPENFMQDLEDFYAFNKCFIPRALWGKIEKEFAAARSSEQSRDAHLNYLNFVLNFTVYKPKPLLEAKDGMTIDQVKAELDHRIDQFFKNYAKTDDVAFIKLNVAKFVDSLLSFDAKAVAQTPRYIYLYGSGGIGKTHFVQELSDWVAELIPGSVQFEDIIINSLSDLQGSAADPGVFLQTVRNQLVKNRRGSILMIDEATWLNDGGMIGAAKRVFNGNQSKLTTSYFGSNFDGTDITFALPPMLIFVASNDEIQDAALASRFDVVHYPMPTQHALVEYAYNIAQNSSAVQHSAVKINKDAVSKWVNNLDQMKKNFRYIAGNIESHVLSSKYR